MTLNACKKNKKVFSGAVCFVLPADVISCRIFTTSSPGSPAVSQTAQHGAGFSYFILSPSFFISCALVDDSSFYFLPEFCSVWFLCVRACVFLQGPCLPSLFHFRLLHSRPLWKQSEGRGASCSPLFSAHEPRIHCR